MRKEKLVLIRHKPCALCIRKYECECCQTELISDDEYALWEQVLAHAEEQSAAVTLSRSETSLPPVAEVLLRKHQAAENALANATHKLPDLEDFGLKLNRLVKHRPVGLVVTDITSSEWCQQQLAFTLSARLPKEVTETEAMAAGTVVHAALEAELIKKVQIDIVTREDAWAVRMLNMIHNLQQLQVRGRTREMYIWGSFKGHWIRGIIDHLELDEQGKVKVVEHKTRRAPSLPRAAQQQTAKLQVMTYRLLLEQLSETCSLAKLTAFFHLLKLNPMQPLSEPVQQHAQTLGLSLQNTSAGQVATLTSLAEHLHQQAKTMPQCSEEVSVRYIWQADSEVLGEINSVYEHKWVVFRLQQHIDFWEGIWKPQPVPVEETWKCHHCMFCRECPVGLESLNH